MTACHPKTFCLCREPYICRIVDNDFTTTNSYSTCRFTGTSRIAKDHKLKNWFFIDYNTQITNIWFLERSDKYFSYYEFMVEAELSSYEPFTSYEMWCYTDCNGWSLMEKHDAFKQVYADPNVVIQKLMHLAKTIR